MGSKCRPGWQGSWGNECSLPNPAGPWFKKAGSNSALVLSCVDDIARTGPTKHGCLWMLTLDKETCCCEQTAAGQGDGFATALVLQRCQAMTMSHLMRTAKVSCAAGAAAQAIRQVHLVVSSWCQGGGVKEWAQDFADNRSVRWSCPQRTTLKLA